MHDLFQIPGVSVPAPDVEPQAKKPKLDCWSRN